MFENLKTVVQLFEDQVALNPNNIAIEYQNITLSYKALNEITNKLARNIRINYEKVTGAKLIADVLIPLSIERSADYVIAILAILKARGAYVPINPEYPDNRINHILSDINSKIIITTRESFPKFAAINADLFPIFIEDLPHLNEDCSNLNLPINATDLAYVIYTSGSSGTPKGVMAHHVTALAQTVGASYFRAGPADTITFFSDVSFDSTTVEIWGALLHGARLFIPEDLFNLLSSPEVFRQTLINKKITISLLTRSLFDLLYSTDETVFESLNLLMVGGEALTKNIMQQLVGSKYRPKKIINAYGPTENSTFCTVYDLDNDFSYLNSVPIGRPYSNRAAFVLDKHLQLMPIGVTGELYVGGPSLSRGYLNQPELTKKAFIANPFPEECPYPRIYKTNDLVKWLPNLNLEYIGRNDSQVKLRGYRIELGEIETRTLQFPGIKHAIAIVNHNAGLSYLICYYVAENALDEGSIRQHLAQNLPEYMIPSVFIYLETLPVTTNGKLDRKALPLPKFQPGPDLNNQTSGTVEQKIASIWSRFLNIPKFNRDTSFFELGGSSLVAIAIRKELEDTFNINLNIVDLFVHTTLAKLSLHINNLIASNSQIRDFKNPDLFYPSNDSMIDELIAVVGMSCRLPGVKDLDSFWQLIVNEKSNLVDFTTEDLKAAGLDEKLITNEHYVKRGAVFSNPFAFDAGFFGYSAKDAELLDPQQRQFLECAWEALEHSGNVPKKFNGDISVFATEGRNYYFLNNVYPSHQNSSEVNLFQAILANEKDFLSTKVSFKLNLTGPSITLQTACSSSLVAIQMACESLKTKSSDMALAGGVSLFYNHGYLYEKDLIESRDGYCRAFDANANGTVVTSGVGVVVLKRLREAIQQKDTIYAVIKGGGVNNDGASKMAFTAPSVAGQSAVIEKALKNAKVSANSISYIETHGTGTSLGDPIEWTALHNVYEKYCNKKEFCTLGALKTNIGHTDSAAGVFGLIKAVLALKYQTLPATLNFSNLNPEIKSFNKLFRVSNTTTRWESDNIRRAAVSSFGLGGTNAHVILEEYIDNDKLLEANTTDYYLIPFSAKNNESLDGLRSKFENYFATSQANCKDIAFTAHRRDEFNQRGFFIIHRPHKNESISVRFTYISDDGIDPKIYLVLSKFNITSFEQFKNLYNNEDFQEAFQVLFSLLSLKSKIDTIAPPTSRDLFAGSSSCAGFLDPANKSRDVGLKSRVVETQRQVSLDEAFLVLIGWLWSHGKAVQWDKVFSFSNAKKIPIPTYVFSRKHYEIKKPNINPSPLIQDQMAANEPINTDALLRGIWSEVLGVGLEELSNSSHFIELGGDSLAFIDLLKHIEKSFHLHLQLGEVLEHSEFATMLQYIESKVG